MLLLAAGNVCVPDEWVCNCVTRTLTAYTPWLASVKSNQIYLLKTSHLRVAIDKTVDEQGRQGSKEHLQWPLAFTDNNYMSLL